MIWNRVQPAVRIAADERVETSQRIGARLRALCELSLEFFLRDVLRIEVGAGGSCSDFRDERRVVVEAVVRPVVDIDIAPHRRIAHLLEKRVARAPCLLPVDRVHRLRGIDEERYHLPLFRRQLRRISRKSHGGVGRHPAFDITRPGSSGCGIGAPSSRSIAAGGKQCDAECGALQYGIRFHSVLSVGRRLSTCKSPPSVEIIAVPP